LLAVVVAGVVVAFAVDIEVAVGVVVGVAVGAAVAAIIDRLVVVVVSKGRTGVNAIKLFFLSLKLRSNKLECLSYFFKSSLLFVIIVEIYPLPYYVRLRRCLPSVGAPLMCSIRTVFRPHSQILH